MELADVESFLILADELHFGRTGARLYVSSARISQRIQALEREVGAQLFQRSSRAVRLTPVGITLRERLEPAYRQLLAAVERAQAEARAPAGTLRLGFTASTGGEVVTDLVHRFEAGNPTCRTVLHEVAIGAPYDLLRAGEIDVLVGWQVVEADDLTIGPKLTDVTRMLLVAADHPLAGQATVSSEVLAEYPVPRFVSVDPGIIKLMRTVVPDRTPSGRPIRFHPHPVRTLGETVNLVALGTVVHPTLASVPVDHDRLRLIPLTDMPPLPLGLIWCTAHENSRIRAIAASAARSPASTVSLA